MAACPARGSRRVRGRRGCACHRWSLGLRRKLRSWQPAPYQWSVRLPPLADAGGGDRGSHSLARDRPPLPRAQPHEWHRRGFAPDHRRASRSRAFAAASAAFVRMENLPASSSATVAICYSMKRPCRAFQLGGDRRSERRRLPRVCGSRRPLSGSASRPWRRRAGRDAGGPRRALSPARACRRLAALRLPPSRKRSTVARCTSRRSADASCLAVETR
jgi:hypothetical protein